MVNFIFDPDTNEDRDTALEGLDVKPIFAALTEDDTKAEQTATYLYRQIYELE